MSRPLTIVIAETFLDGNRTIAEQNLGGRFLVVTPRAPGRARGHVATDLVVSQAMQRSPRLIELYEQVLPAFVTSAPEIAAEVRFRIDHASQPIVSAAAIAAFTEAWEKARTEIGRGIAPAGTKTRAGLAAAAPIIIRDNAGRTTNA